MFGTYRQLLAVRAAGNCQSLSYSVMVAVGHEFDEHGKLRPTAQFDVHAVSNLDSGDWDSKSANLDEEKSQIDGCFYNYT